MTVDGCHCQHTWYGNHPCGGALSSISFAPDIELIVCLNCKDIITKHDLGLHSAYLEYPASSQQ